MSLFLSFIFSEINSFISDANEKIFEFWKNENKTVIGNRLS